MVFRRSPVSPYGPHVSVLRRAGVGAATALLMLVGTVGLTAFVATNPAAASGTARYVAQGGSDTSNDCSAPATPCATISNAVSQSNSGDTVYVSGTINDQVTISTSLTVTQWPTQPQAAVDGTNSGTPFTINSGSTVTLNKLIIEDGLNSSGLGGGGILNLGSLTITECTVEGNVADPAGGGITNVGNLTVTGSTVVNNQANDPVNGGSAGGILNESSLTLTDSTVSGNQAVGGQAGGLYSDFGNATVRDSTISGNTANDAGGVFSTSLVLLASTVSGNTAVNEDGGGLFTAGNVFVGATIVADNTGGNCFNFGPVATSAGYNLTDDPSSDNTCGFTQSTDVVNAIPNLGSLTNNGGPTQTMLPPNPSPEAFVIPNPTSGMCPRTDQRGVPSPSGGACTIGAVEAIPGVAPSVPSGRHHTWITGQHSAFTLTATGTPAPTIIYPYGQPGSGKLPNGLTFSSRPGVAAISGTPFPNAGGTYKIQLVGSNGFGSPDTKFVTVVVQQPPVMSLPPNGGTVGFKAGVASSVPWSVSAPATTWTHISQPVTYTTSGFPAGLTFNNNGNGTGTMSGTLAKGTYGPMSIKASNVAGSSTTTFFIKAA